MIHGGVAQRERRRRAADGGSTPSASTTAPWVPCGCGNYWCKLHRRHAHECPCPPVEEWESNPYSDERRRECAENGLPACGCRDASTLLHVLGCSERK